VGLISSAKDTRYKSKAPAATISTHAFFQIAIEILNEGRIGIAAQMLGLAQGAFDLAVPYTYQRKQSGQAIGAYQAMAHSMAKTAINIEAARLLTYNAARL
jgi:short/branched chain acyl-CoA dehydrogenase